MSRLEGGVGTFSSISRSSRRCRSSLGARRVLPAPAAVPVDRRVGMGFVRPLTVRPVAGVWASRLSRPVPPRRETVDWPALARDLPVVLRDLAADLRGVLARFRDPAALFFRAAEALRARLALGVLAPAVRRLVFRLAAPARRDPALLRLPPVLFAVFLAIVDSPGRLRLLRLLIDSVALSDVSSNAYRNSAR